MFKTEPVNGASESKYDNSIYLYYLIQNKKKIF